MEKNNSSPEMAIFLAYKDAPAGCWPLVLNAAILNAIGTAGIAMNAGVIWTTWKNRKGQLNGTANFLLALCSFVELLHQLGNFLFAWTAFSGRYFIDYQTAVSILMLPIFGIWATPLVVALIALDRMLIVLFPLGADAFLRPGPVLLSAITVFCTLAPAYFMAAFFQSIAHTPNLQVTGLMRFLFQGKVENAYADYSIGLNLATMVCYAVIGVAIRCKKSVGEGENAVHERHRRIFRSLLFIVVVNVGAYVVVVCHYFFVIPRIAGSPVLEYFSLIPVGSFVNISAASNGPILYWTSSEYRQAFQKEIGLLKKLLCFHSHQHQIHPLSVVEQGMVSSAAAPS